MLRSTMFRVLFCLVFISALLPPPAEGIARPAASVQGLKLVKDINAVPGSSSPRSLHPVNNKLFFMATDFEHGLELWKMEGNPPAASLVKDINPGRDGILEPGSYPDVGSLGNFLFFPAYTPDTGEELWKSDGTPEGTVLVKDIYPGCAPTFMCPKYGSTPGSFINANGWIFFLASDSTGRHLWRSDGTSENTLQVTDLAVHSLYLMAAYNGWLYFRAQEPASAATNHGWELWRTDGTPGNIELVADINPTGDSYPNNLLVSGDSLFFTASDGVNGSELWKTDPFGTSMVKDILPGSASSAPSTLIKFDNKLYFAATITNDYKQGLMRSDGTASGTTLVFNHCPESCPDSRGFLVIGSTPDRLFFKGSNGILGNGLWKTDGTPENTTPVKNICAAPDYSDLQNFVGDLNGVLIFIGAENCPNNSPADSELWRSDGTPDGTYLLKDIFPGPQSSYLYDLIVFNGRIYFSADDGIHGDELWVTDGTPDGTALVADINQHTPDANIIQMTPFGNKLFFGASDGTYEGPWISDGSEAGTIPLAVNPDNGSGPGIYSRISYYEDPDLKPIVADGNVYFLAASRSPVVLWHSDGTPAGTQVVSELPGLPRAMAGLGQDVFGLSVNTSQITFWRAKPDGSLEVIKTFPGPHWYPSNFTKRNGQLYFLVDNVDLLQNELWKSDGTSANTMLVKAFPRVNYGGSDYNGDFSASLAANSSLIFFNLNTAEYGREIWQSDGTAAGTVLVEDEVPGGNLYIQDMYVINDMLYFGAEQDAPFRVSLYKTRGQVTGIERVVIMPGLSSGPRSFTSMGSMLYLRATGQNELWKSDGTATGTVEVRPDLWVQNELVPFMGKLYFGARDAEHGFELWSSDGTSARTRFEEDIYPGSPSSFTTYFCLATAGDNLFLVVEDGVHGAELWMHHVQYDHQIYLPAISY